jgi:phosphoribosylaminoimidazole-succinocarboxamide synthase
MSYVRGELLYEGKAKRVYSVQNETHFVWLEYKNSLTAFNALKKGEFQGKGQLNRNIASILFRELKKKEINSHWVSDIGDHDMVCKKLEMVPLEVVVRNVVAGSLAKKFGIEEGTPLREPLVELYYKHDALQDPFISDDQALLLKFIESQAALEVLKTQALKINQVLKDVFKKIDIDLVDFKIEFGREKNGNFILADEISPDSCRLWDTRTGEKLDKDRFRRDLGKVEESYQEVWTRLSHNF